MTEVGIVYGGVLYDLCQHEGISDPVLAELGALETSFAQAPAFIRLLRSPSLNKAERCDVLDHCFRGRVQPYLLNFLKILTEKGYPQHFSDCCRTYRDCYHKDHNILIVTATTAEALTRGQTRRLTEKLTTMTGKTVQLQQRVDSALLGGILLDYDGKRMDDTIARRIEMIRNRLINTVL